MADLADDIDVQQWFPPAARIVVMWRLGAPSTVACHKDSTRASDHTLIFPARDLSVKVRTSGSHTRKDQLGVS
jgi:hypothetical protein